MVGAVNLGVNLCVLNTRLEPLACHEVIDTPPGILLTRLKTVRPPRVGYLLRVFPTEGIDETLSKQLGELLALLIGKSGITAVGLGSSMVAVA